MIGIDGSYGSGGGQIIRTALALSALTGKEFRIFNIRAKRKKPGLQPQHLSCVNAVAKLCNAKVEGNFLGSNNIEFFPGRISEENLKIDIGTAGSISLVLQALMPALVKITKPIEMEIIGGTDVKLAPTIDYIKNVLLNLLEKIGYDAKIEILRRGFYPKGGGIIKFGVMPPEIKRYEFIEREKLLCINGISVASESLRKARVAERQAEEVKKLLYNFNLPLNIKTEYIEAYSDGSVVTLWLETEKSILGASALGERGKRSEDVAKEAAEKLVDEIKNNAVVDKHASDQLLPYLALTEGILKASEITEHAKTNAFVIEKFLPVKFKIDEINKTIECKKQF